jgi:NAD+ diphosphatase
MPFVHRHAPNATPAAHDVCLVIQVDQLLARTGAGSGVELPLFAAMEGWTDGATPPLHVGALDDRPCWLCVVESRDPVNPPAGWQWHDTRALLSLLTPAQAHAVHCARQLLYWGRRHRFCGVCGTPTVDSGEERSRQCPKCGAVFFPSVSPAIIVAVNRGDELLLAHNRNFRAGMFSLLAGFVDPGETLEQAVAREVREEVGIEIADISYVASQPWPFPNSLMLGFRARFLGGEIAVDGKEIETAGWYRRDALPDIPRQGTVARQLIDAWVANRG